jgi:hypothetical protein
MAKTIQGTGCRLSAAPVFALPRVRHSARLGLTVLRRRADTNDFLLASGVPRTSIYLTFYYSNMFLFDAIHKGADGALSMILPFPTDSPIPSLAASDVGGFVSGAFLLSWTWINSPTLSGSCRFSRAVKMDRAGYAIMYRVHHSQAVRDDIRGGVRVCSLTVIIVPQLTFHLRIGSLFM